MAVPLLAVSALGGLAASGYQAKRSRDITKREGERAERKMDDLERQRVQREGMLQIEAQNKARREKQRLKGLAVFGPSSNVRTSPVGLPGGGTSYPVKTAIGT